MRNEGWEKSIKDVLRAANEPMHYLKITEQILKRRLKERTATTEKTVSATITKSIKKNGGRSPFVWKCPGTYSLRKE
jgi:HB1/ASXL restriction endonuclease-like protein with HTH domain